MGTYQWNPANLTVQLLHSSRGIHIVTGFAPDSFVNVDVADDLWNVRVSSDGKVVTRNKINNPVGELAIVLEMASPSNAWLQDVINDDKTNETGIVALFVSDDKGRERASASKAWLRRQPGHPYGADPGTRSWMFTAADLLVETRGSSQVAEVSRVGG